MSLRSELDREDRELDKILRGREPGATRRVEPDYPPDPAVWLAANRMSRTEVALRLARHLLARHLVSGDVDVALTGHELTRRDQPRFPVVRYLAERDCMLEERISGWQGRYSLKGAHHAFRLHDQPDVGDVVAPLASGRRLVAFVSAGLLDASRSPAEHTLLRNALGRALTFEAVEPGDLCTAVVPRSPRFRALAVRWRAAPTVMRSGILILTVDRAGMVEGLTPMSSRA